MEQKVIAFYVHPNIGALRIYKKIKQQDGKYTIYTPIGELKDVPINSIILPTLLPTGIDM